MDEKQLSSELKKDIRAQNNITGGGRDFFGPFWRDVKDHIKGISDLTDQTAIRINDSIYRKNLYPKLRDGFLLWWDNKRRWSNEKVSFLHNSVKGHYFTSKFDTSIKIENLLSLKLGNHTKKLIYPYFSETPKLTDESARVGLWLMKESLNEYDLEDIRILDVIRGKSFSISDTPLVGNEEFLFLKSYGHILSLREKLIEEKNNKAA